MASRSSIGLLLVGAIAAAAARSPGYCMPGQAFPRSPPAALPLAAGVHPGGVPVQSAAGDDDGGGAPALPGGRLAEQGDFAASLVTEAECGLSTVHGRPYCDALAAED
ncbi:alpha-amylase/trypsin inhibitor CMa-like [Miscanthus floridulus]|uniref:alpha-amylase/trypsin inhibitor CMa-like n=1 Tax=Miscanthus floridulus TaxID=154761 RepID=UPI00345A9452